MRCLVVSAALLGLFGSVIVAEEKPAASKDEKITFDQHILPIFREKCGSCHNASDKKGDLVLDNYGLAMQGGASGEVIRADGDASQSQLYLVVAHLAEPKMPPQQPKLPDEQLTLIRKWIEGGSLENAGSKAKAKKTMAVAKVEVSNQRPAGPPPMPENLLLDPLVVASRGNGVTASLPIRGRHWRLSPVISKSCCSIRERVKSPVYCHIPKAWRISSNSVVMDNGYWLAADVAVIPEKS